MIVRLAGVEDLPVIRAMFEAHLAALGYPPDPALDADMIDVLAAYRAPDAFLLAVEGRSVIGMGGVLAGEIRRIYVVPEHRSSGVARALIDVLRRRYAGRRAVVADDNLPARRLFERCGFARTGEVPDHPKMQHCRIHRC